MKRNELLEVKFYDNIDDKLLKFAVIISKTNGELERVNIKNEILTKYLEDIEIVEKIF